MLPTLNNSLNTSARSSANNSTVFSRPRQPPETPIGSRKASRNGGRRPIRGNMKKLPDQKKNRKGLTIDKLGNVTSATPINKRLCLGRPNRSRATLGYYEIAPYRVQPSKVKKAENNEIPSHLKIIVREVLAGLQFAIRKEIESQQLTMTELFRILEENRGYDNRAEIVSRIAWTSCERSAASIRNLTDYYERNYSKLAELAHLDMVTFVVGGVDLYDEEVQTGPQPMNQTNLKLADLTVDKACEFRSLVEVNNFFIETYFEEKVNLSFEDMLEVLQNQFKKEFTAKAGLQDATWKSKEVIEEHAKGRRK